MFLSSLLFSYFKSFSLFMVWHVWKKATQKHEEKERERWNEARAWSRTPLAICMALLSMIQIPLDSCLYYRLIACGEKRAFNSKSIRVNFGNTQLNAHILVFVSFSLPLSPPLDDSVRAKCAIVHSVQ